MNIKGEARTSRNPETEAIIDHVMERLFKTARAKLACAHFAAGDFVGVSYDHTAADGVTWYIVTKDEARTVYPEHHLADFVL